MARTAAAGAATTHRRSLGRHGLRGESEGRYGSRRDSTCGAPGRSPRRDLFPLIFEFVFLTIGMLGAW